MLLNCSRLLILDVLVPPELSLLIAVMVWNTFDGCTPGVQCLGDEEDDTNKAGSRHCCANPEDRLPAPLEGNVTTRDATSEWAHDEHNGIDSLGASVSI